MLSDYIIEDVGINDLVYELEYSAYLQAFKDEHNDDNNYRGEWFPPYGKKIKIKER